MSIQVATRLSGGVSIITPTGAMTTGSGCEQIRETLMRQYETGSHHLLIDCSNLTLVDSAGLGEIVAGYSAIARRGGSLKLLHPTPRLRELLKTTRLDLLLETHDDERAAIDSFSNRADLKAQQVLNDFLK